MDWRAAISSGLEPLAQFMTNPAGAAVQGNSGHQCRCSSASELDVSQRAAANWNRSL